MTKTIILTLIFVLAAFGAPAQDLPLITSDIAIGPRDVLDIKVLEDPTIGGRVAVSDDGTVILNVIGKLAVAGLTPPQIEAKLKSVLEASFITKATISVQVAELGSKPISVLGAVQHPGRIGAAGNMTLIQALTQAGGLTGTAGTELYVVRASTNGLTERLSINVEDLLVNGNSDLNIPLAPNDLVNVPADAPISIYVMGEVSRPGKVQFRSSQTPTLLQAIADAGGPTDRAAKTVILKRMVEGKQQTVKVNFRDIIKGKKADVVLHDNDTVVIEESIF
ncbi:MAG TPA: polysaccharide biosynthesis/export family protein [Thermoanaerobaculia bacterium]|nr:polysaccharide biosynthesis/export family protein [Thermoanaerobaculia bacterium]